MMKYNQRIDEYIARSEEFARPVLTYLRKIIHDVCPEAKETVKWGFPHFEYRGVLCSMASFKKHCAFMFWNGKAMSDPYGLFTRESMGDFGKIGGISDLPSEKILKEYLSEAVKLNEAGIKRQSPKPSGNKELAEPDYFLKELKKNADALKTYEGFNYTNKKEYLEWIVGAKTETTRSKRLATAIEWMAEGKIRNWKYVKK